MERPLKRPCVSFPDPFEQLYQRRARNDLHLKSKFESIFQKYSKDFSKVGDEIDIVSGEIVVNNGHIQSMENEQDVIGGRDQPDELGDGGPDEDRDALHAQRKSYATAQKGGTYVVKMPIDSGIGGFEDDNTDSIMGDIQEPVASSAYGNIAENTKVQPYAITPSRTNGTNSDGYNIAGMPSQRYVPPPIVERLKQTNLHHHVTSAGLITLEEPVVESAWRTPPLPILQPDYSPRLSLSSTQVVEHELERPYSPPGLSLWSSMRTSKRPTVVKPRVGGKSTSKAFTHHSRGVKTKSGITPVRRNSKISSPSTDIIASSSENIELAHNDILSLKTEQKKATVETPDIPLEVSSTSWSPKEDQLLRYLRTATGLDYSEIGKYFPGRTIDTIKTQCTQYMRDVSGEPFTEQEDKLIHQLKATTELTFDDMVSQFPGRTSGLIKKRWSLIREQKNVVELESTLSALQCEKRLPHSYQIPDEKVKGSAKYCEDTSLLQPVSDIAGVDRTKTRQSHFCTRLHSTALEHPTKKTSDCGHALEPQGDAEISSAGPEVDDIAVDEYRKDSIFYTPEEDALLLDLRKGQGLAWKDIIKRLNGRSTKSASYRYELLIKKAENTTQRTDKVQRQVYMSEFDEVDELAISDCSPRSKSMIKGVAAKHVKGTSFSAWRTAELSRKKKSENATRVMPREDIIASDSASSSNTTTFEQPYVSRSSTRSRRSIRTSRIPAVLERESESSRSITSDVHDAADSLRVSKSLGNEINDESCASNTLPKKPFEVPSVVVMRTGRFSHTDGHQSEYSKSSPRQSSTMHDNNQVHSHHEELLVSMSKEKQHIRHCGSLSLPKINIQSQTPAKIHVYGARSKPSPSKRKIESKYSTPKHSFSSILGDFSDDELSLPFLTIATPRAEVFGTPTTSIRWCGSLGFKCERAICLRCS
ncbi:hypothetical protein MMC06_000820 [Schaereria dolodes]|nr:hypothetical protein [Schaereria dolodes]